MIKPRIIIADIDLHYIVPLQVKFVEEFFDKIELEIITDKKYLDALFSTPQRAEILIISEELYDVSIQKHTISNIFLMMEQYVEGQTDALNLNCLFKYTSIKEIFNEITSKSAGALNIDATTKKETQVILVYSACGGVGKTTIAMGVSACLSKNYKRVLYLNADRLQSFHNLLENPTPIATPDVYTKLSAGFDNMYPEIKHVIRKEVFNYLPPFKAALMSLNISYAIYEKLIVSIKKTNDYDFIVIDADTTFDKDKAKLLDIADKVIIVTEQTNTSVFATNLLVSNINGTDADKYIFVCNNFDKNNDNALISPNMVMKFRVHEYVERCKQYSQMKCEDLSKENGIQKTAFLIV